MHGNSIMFNCGYWQPFGTFPAGMAHVAAGTKTLYSMFSSLLFLVWFGRMPEKDPWHYILVSGLCDIWWLIIPTHLHTFKHSSKHSSNLQSTLNHEINEIITLWLSAA